MRLVIGYDQIVAEWVARHIPHADTFERYTAIGVEDGKGFPVAGVVFTNYVPSFRCIEISCAAETSRWLTKSIISAIFAYPFGQLGCQRISAVTPHIATSTRRFLEKLGFVQEGVIRLGLGDADAVVYGLLASDWAHSRFNLRRVDGGKEDPPGPNARRSRRARQRASKRKHRDGAGKPEAQYGEHLRA